jgi:tRNA 2-thiouridine synthesizing protein A
LTLRRPSAYRNPLKALAGSEMAEKTVSLRGLKCPLPALRTKKLLAGLQSGDELTIECTDPLSAIDIPNLLRQTGDTLAGQSKDGELLVFRIRKK